MSRKVLIAIAIPLLLVIAAAILLSLLLDEEKVVEMASQALREQTGAVLQIDGETRLSLFPTLGVSLSDASLRMPEGRDGDISVRSLDIGVQLIPLLSGRLAKEAVQYSVVNMSISGETTSGGRTRLPQLLQRHRPSIVVLQLGANDGLRGLSLASMQRQGSSWTGTRSRAGPITLA